MIPINFIREWQSEALWVSDAQIEQDLIISRALVEIYRQPEVSKTLAFRGGTALYKLFIRPPLRYSEDIDLVQMVPQNIGPVLDSIREVLDPWLGGPRRIFNEGRVTLTYRIQPEEEGAGILKLKLEANTREHFSAFGFKQHSFTVESRWFSGKSVISTYDINELLGTKLRALFQRKKGRDLFDLWAGLQVDGSDPDRILEAFQRYMTHEENRVSRAQFEMNMDKKMKSDGFLRDITALLPLGTSYNPKRAFELVHEKLISRLEGNPWRHGKTIKNAF